ncbi:MAG: hypothetical protein KDB14_22410, partial [Planctomycetales bacterium]|nr:hypothetical protein [Planctomycetales bacterium]
MDIDFSELLEFLHEFKHGGKQGIQALLGAVAEPVLNGVYMRDHRPPGTPWHSTEAPDAEDWRDATLFESSLAAADSLKEFLAVRNGLDPATLRNGTPKRIPYPDMITLATSFAEWYELKPARVENGNRNAKWSHNSSHKKSLDRKAESLASLTQTFGLRPMAAGQRVKNMMNGESLERLAIPLGDDITIDDVRNILSGDVNTDDFQAAKRITVAMLRQLAAAVVSSQGYFVRFKWHRPGMLLWRLTDQGDTEEKWQPEFNHRVVPVPPPVTVPEEEQQHDLVYERLIEAVREPLLIALTVILVVAIIW